MEDIIEDADLYKDSDGDGVSDYHEKKIAAGEMQIGTGESLNLCSNMDYMSADSDGDGLTDGEEIKITKNEADNNYYVYLYSNPCSKDTDEDGYDDFVEAYIGSSSITKKNYLGFNNDFSNMEIMPGFKLNNWYDWQELIKEDAWNYIHNAVQADVVARYAPNITAEHTIKNVGRCDLYRSARKEMWEVKPSSYSK